MKLPRPIGGPVRRLLGRVVGRDPTTARPIQVAALPWRRVAGGGIEVLLITGRRSPRWLAPKGWPMRNRTLAEAAAREAFEEAGVEGRIEPRAIGRFPFLKNHPLLGRLRVTVLLFPLAVERECDQWPEKGQRGRLWLSPEAAAKQVVSRDLARLILAFAAKVPAETPERTSEVQLNPM